VYCKGVQIQEDKSDGTCGIYRREKMLAGFYLENLKENTTLETLA